MTMSSKPLQVTFTQNGHLFVFEIADYKQQPAGRIVDKIWSRTMSVKEVQQETDLMAFSAKMLGLHYRICEAQGKV